MDKTHDVQRYGHWTVRKAVRKWPNLGRETLAYVPVRCDCGTLSFVLRKHLETGASRSCGCEPYPCDKKR